MKRTKREPGKVKSNGFGVQVRLFLLGEVKWQREVKEVRFQHCRSEGSMLAHGPLSRRVV